MDRKAFRRRKNQVKHQGGEEKRPIEYFFTAAQEPETRVLHCKPSRTRSLSKGGAETQQQRIIK